MSAWNSLSGDMGRSPSPIAQLLVQGFRHRRVLAILALLSLIPASTYAGFAVAPTYPPGALSVALADFNRDGILDIAAANGNNGVGILLGNGDGTFQAAQNYAAGGAAWSVAVGDLNGDGILDLAVANNNGPSGTVSILLGNGDGTFQAPQSYAAGSNPYFVVLADFNGDGALDLAVANNNDANGTVSILLGNGDGTFQAPQSYATGGADPQSLAVGDFNQDGHLDFAVANYTFNGTVTIYTGRGDGTFNLTGVSVLGPGVTPTAVATGDLNGDGHLDLAVSATGRLYILLGNGNGSFQSPQSYPLGLTPIHVAIGDFNNDGHLDVLVAGNRDVGILLGNGDGTFRAGNFFAAGGDGLVVGDINSDGNLDIVSADASLGAMIMLGNGDGTFRAAHTFPFDDGGNSSVAVADFNGDGHLDVAVGQHIFLANGDGTFQESQFVGVSAEGVVAEDFNHDGIPDLAVSSGGSLRSFASTSILLGKGDGTFQVAQSFNFGSAASPVVGDFNGDGIPDLAVTVGNAVMILLGNGNGTFQAPQNYATGGGSLAVADFNRDGVLDIATSGGSLLLGNGDGTFQPAQSFVTGPGNYSIAVGDFNGDGIPDLVQAGSTTYQNLVGTVSILLGNGDGTFQAPEIYAAGAFQVANPTLVVGDFNQDGIQDVAVANGETVNVLLGNGDGTFQAALPFHAAPTPYSLAVGDFNGDGLPDLAVVGGGLTILLDDGHWGP